MARKKAEGIKLGRPKGKKSIRVKLSGRENTIKDLIDNSVSISQIARIFKVNRMTVSKFIKERLM